VPHCFEHVHLIDGIFSLLSVHLRYVDDFHHVGLSIGHGLD
jgi:hypothetical protein